MTIKVDRVKYLLSANKVSDFPIDEVPEIVVSGRSNVGKSSLLNFLTNRNKLAHVSKTPGKTRSINFFSIPGPPAWRLVDLPGYGYAALARKDSREWGPVIDAYLRDRQNLKAVLQLVDSRHDPTDLDLLMIDWLMETGVPTILVLTKIDKLNMNTRRQVASSLRKKFLSRVNWPIVETSSEKKIGRENLLIEITKILECTIDKKA